MANADPLEFVALLVINMWPLMLQILMVANRFFHRSAGTITDESSKTVPGRPYCSVKLFRESVQKKIHVNIN